MSSGYKGPAVVFDQVFKAFGAHQVLRNVSFFASSGEFVGNGERQRAVLVRNW